MNELFSIGELSKHQNISRQTLIFYDKIGLFRPAYVDPENGYRYYSAAQLDYLDTICMMKKIGFSLEKIKAHLKSYTLDTSLAALLRQLAIIDRQIADLQLIKSRVEHRCAQLEQSAAIHADSTAVSVEQVKRQYLLLQEVAAPYTLEEVSIATKKCFVRSFREQLPIFFQSGAVVPLERIRAGRYTEASFAFLPIEKSSAKSVVKLPAGQCTVTYHTGDYLSIGRAYERILEYCRSHRLSVVSDAYEFAINDYLSTGNEAEYITRLSLSSSSVDEVIKKRVLAKTEDADHLLQMEYEKEASGLKSLFAFDNPILDIKGFTSAAEFSATFPFVPYQFIVIQKVLAEIRKHGNSGKHLSGGERSMLSGFQEAAQKVENKDENALVPFYQFYDTVHTFLESAIRRVIDRCQNAADAHDGLEQQDVNVLKLLYLVRYIEDVKANIENIAILMIDDIHTDKIALRASITASLERLLSQNYISRNGDTYAFLTDEEQDIAIDIKNTPVDSAQIVQSISQTVYGEIYPAKKYKYGKYDFAYDQYVDETLNGASTGGMRLRIVTVASDLYGVGDQRLIMDSQVNNEAIIVLSADTPYFDELEQAMKIRKYVKQRNVSQMPESIQRIIRDRNDEARKLESHARSLIEKAIVEGKFYVHGEILDLKYGSAKDKLDEAMKSLVESVYSKLNMVNQFVDSDADILAILNGAYEDVSFTGLGANNEDALNEISQWLELQNQKMLKTSMGDVQRRYQAIPYGWKEIDIAALIARLIVQQKIQINYGGAVVGKEERRLVDFLRKKTEIDKAIVARRIAPSEELIRKSVNFLRDYLGAMDIPSDEDGLIRFVLNTFETKQSHYQKLLDEFYSKERYPEKETVTAARDLMNDVLSQRKDNVALLKRMVQRQDDLLDSAEDMEGVEMFFKAQRTVFDDARNRLASITKERDYFAADADTLNVISTMSAILAMPKPYSRIGELPELVQKVKTAYDGLLDMKREEVAENIRQCMQDVHQLASEARDAGALLHQADDHFANKREAAKTATSLTELDAMITQLLNYKDTICRRMEVMSASRQQEAQKPAPAATTKPGTPAPKPPKIMTVRRYDLCSVKRLQSKEDIDKYVEAIREKLMKTLESCDGVQIN